MNKYSSIGNMTPSFTPAAANDDVNFFFTDREVREVQETLYPYGGTFYMSDILLNGLVCGQKMDIHTPLVGKRNDSHVITLFKVAVSDTQVDFAARDVETDSVFPSNDFGHALHIGKKLIDRYEKAMQRSIERQP